MTESHRRTEQSETSGFREELDPFLPRFFTGLRMVQSSLLGFPAHMSSVTGDDLHFAFWDGVEEVLAVAFVDDAGIEDDYDSGIGLAAN